MSQLTELISRVAALEREVEKLKLQRASPREGKKGWLERMCGSMNDYPEFEEVVKLGAAWRRAQIWETEPETHALRQAAKAKSIVKNRRKSKATAKR